MSDKKFKRRRYLVHGFQKKYALFLVAVLAVYTLFLACFLLIPPALKLSSTATLDEKAEAARLLLGIGEHLWPAVIIGIAVVIILAIFITHRLAGPIYRFEKGIERFINGDLLVRIKLRNKDELSELSELLNEAINNVNSAMIEMGDAVEKMTDSIKKIAADSSVKQGRDAYKSMMEIKAETERIKNILGRFDIHESKDIIN